MTNQTEEANAESVSSSASCAQAEPTPWTITAPPETGEVIDASNAAVWGGDGDLVAEVHSNPVYGVSALDRARLLAAAGTAAYEAQEMGHDPHEALQVLPALLEARKPDGPVGDALRALKGAADYIEDKTDSKLGAARLHRLADEAADTLGLEITVKE